MTLISYAEQATTTCPNCGQSFTFDIWLIVDPAERSDLATRIQNGNLHSVVCTHCKQPAGEADAPVLLYRPNAEPVVLFSPAAQTSQKQNRQQANRLVDLLRERLGRAWRDEWLVPSLRDIPREMLSAALHEDPEMMVRQMMAQANAAIEQMRRDDPRAFRKLREEMRQAAQQVNPHMQTIQQFIDADSWEESRQILEAHPELLTEEVDALLGQLVDAARAQDDTNAERAFVQHRDLLQRCREIGVNKAFKEMASE